MAYETTEQAIEAGAEIFARAEDMAHDIKRTFRDLKDVFTRVHQDGHIGALEARALATAADALATQFEADLWAMHSRLTKRAQELDIDLPATRDGGGGR